MKRTTLLLIINLVTVAAIIAQPAIQFDKNTHEFGDILEENGPVNFKFEFTNMGTAPLIVNNVKASCGCTTPGWTKEPVLPGKRGYIEAQYNPQNRPGSFRKSLTVYSNSSAGNAVVFIQGNVTPKPRSLAETLPTKIGNLKMRTRTVNMANITNDKEVVKRFDIYNDGDSPISLVDTETPSYIAVVFEPESIEPGAAGKMVVSYNAKVKNELGYTRDDITLTTNESERQIKKLSVIATVREYFPPMTSAEAAKAPRLKFEKTVMEFGSVTAGEPISATFTFTNLGKTDLNIRSLKPNCNCTKASVKPSDVKPGEKGTIYLTFNTDGRQGVQHQQVTVFSNDPKRSMQTVALRGTVKSK